MAVWWVVWALASALTSVVLFASKGHTPVFFSIVLSNLGLLFVFSFIHQAIASIVDRSRRYVELSAFLIVVQFAASIYFTYILPDVRGRMMVRTSAILIQLIASIVVLLRQRSSTLRDPIRLLTSFMIALRMEPTGRIIS